jgi:hypothetical protein
MSIFWALKRFLPVLLLALLSLSCVTIREDNYIDNTYEEIEKKKGMPDYSIYKIIDKDYRREEYEPDFQAYFNLDGIEEPVTVRYAVWKTLHSSLMIWFIDVDDTWIAFSSTEHRGPFLK